MSRIVKWIKRYTMEHSPAQRRQKILQFWDGARGDHAQPSGSREKDPRWCLPHLEGKEAEEGNQPWPLRQGPYRTKLTAIVPGHLVPKAPCHGCQQQPTVWTNFVSLVLEHRSASRASNGTRGQMSRAVPSCLGLVQLSSRSKVQRPGST